MVHEHAYEECAAGTQPVESKGTGRGAVAWFYRRFVPWWSALGLVPGTATLEVRGRKSGRPIRLSVYPQALGEEEFLVSVAGDRHWARNVRAADGEATLLRGWSSPVRLIEVPVEERTPILLAYVNRRDFASRQMVPRKSDRLASFLNYALPVSEREMKPLAAKFPVFRVTPRLEE